MEERKVVITDADIKSVSVSHSMTGKIILKSLGVIPVTMMFFIFHTIIQFCHIPSNVIDLLFMSERVKIAVSKKIKEEDDANLRL